MFSDKDILKFADLAKFGIPEDRVAEAVEFFNGFELKTRALREYDYSGVKLELDMSQVNALREDVPVPALTREELLENASLSEASCFVVPKIMG